MKQQAEEIINQAQIVTLATINEDGTPRSTMVGATIDGDDIVWQSSVDAYHSQNIDRDNHVAISAFMKPEGGSYRGVYIATRAHQTGREIEDETYHVTLREYRAPIGVYDESSSQTDRLYFKQGDVA